MPPSIRSRQTSSRSPLLRQSRAAAAPAIAAAIAAAVSLGLAACAYQPVSHVRYEPEGPEDVWKDGLRLHPARTDSLTVLTGFLDHGARATPEGPLFGTPLTFLILAQNTSGKAVTLDPMRFRLQVPGTELTLAPLDPEAEIRTAARELADEHGRYAQAQSTEAVIDLAGGVLDLLSLFATTTPEEEAKSRQKREERREQRAEDARDHFESMRAASSHHAQWAGRSLRKTTLLPGMRAQGTVSFVENAAVPQPDTLILVYGSGDARLEPLGRYAKAVDSLPASPGPERPDSLARNPALVPKAVSAPKPASARPEAPALSPKAAAFRP